MLVEGVVVEQRRVEGVEQLDLMRGGCLVVLCIMVGCSNIVGRAGHDLMFQKIQLLHHVNGIIREGDV